MKGETELIKLFSFTSHLYTQISTEFTPGRDYQCVTLRPEKMQLNQTLWTTL